MRLILELEAWGTERVAGEEAINSLASIENGERTTQKKREMMVQKTRPKSQDRRKNEGVGNLMREGGRCRG